MYNFEMHWRLVYHLLIRSYMKSPWLFLTPYTIISHVPFLAYVMHRATDHFFPFFLKCTSLNETHRQKEEYHTANLEDLCRNTLVGKGLHLLLCLLGCFLLLWNIELRSLMKYWALFSMKWWQNVNLIGHTSIWSIFQYMAQTLCVVKGNMTLKSCFTLP